MYRVGGFALIWMGLESWLELWIIDFWLSSFNVWKRLHGVTHRLWCAPRVYGDTKWGSYEPSQGITAVIHKNEFVIATQHFRAITVSRSECSQPLSRLLASPCLETLIEHYRFQWCLWNIKSKDYKNRPIKEYRHCRWYSITWKM